MAELQSLLEERGIKDAVIIDDVFDEYPRPDELSEEDWTVFFDDLGDVGTEQLARLFPAYEDSKSDDLRNSAEFIKVVWENRKNLPPEACDPLFSDYEETRKTERSGLEALATALEELGLTCTKMGSEIAPVAKDADLIFVDLFLGFQQTPEDMSRAIDRISDLVQERKNRPPLVVLMSRSPRLWNKRNEFRDKAGLLGSTFRVIGKADLAKDGTLETLLTRLARPYEDAKRVAAFINAWDNGLDQARKNFIQRLRRLDLSDLAQIQNLLLDFEGQNLGEYLLDVADRVLQHEIEADAATIAAALDLSKIDLRNYPAPHLEGSADLQELVHRMIFQHVERLKISGDATPPVLQFGDLLRYKTPETNELNDNVVAILTPACDLLRHSAENILVLPGKLQKFAASDWSYGTANAKIPIFVDTDESRYWIKWDIGGYHTIPTKSLNESLDQQKQMARIGRLREVCAIELQQRMLTEMGRIGQTANPPATFPVSIGVFLVPPDGPPLRLEIPAMTEGLCFVGRDEISKPIHNLVLSEASCDALRIAMQSLPDDNIHPSARASLTAIKADLDFFGRFERGLVKLPIKVNAPTPETGTDNQIYLHLIRNEWARENEAVTGNLKKAPFIMKICDVLPDL